MDASVSCRVKTSVVPVSRVSELLVADFYRFLSQEGIRRNGCGFATTAYHYAGMQERK